MGVKKRKLSQEVPLYFKNKNTENLNSFCKKIFLTSVNTLNMVGYNPNNLHIVKTPETLRGLGEIADRISLRIRELCDHDGTYKNDSDGGIYFLIPQNSDLTEINATLEYEFATELIDFSIGANENEQRIFISLKN